MEGNAQKKNLIKSGSAGTNIESTLGGLRELQNLLLDPSWRLAATAGDATNTFTPISIPISTSSCTEIRSNYEGRRYSYES